MLMDMPDVGLDEDDIHGLTVLTRNIADFRNLGILVGNPFR